MNNIHKELVKWLLVNIEAQQSKIKILLHLMFL